MIPLKKKFFCNGNVDVLLADKDLVKLSKQAGCIGWLIGFESISQKTIKNVQKTTNTVSDYKKTIDQIHKEKMMVIGDFMFGFDTDTPEIFKSTVNAIIDLGIDVADFTIATPFPGTPFFDSLEEEDRILTKDWRKYTMYSVVYKPRLMNKKELIDGISYVYREFYSPKHTIKRIIRGLNLGLFPFFGILSRNLISMIASKKIR
jgi:radical SAM superfamily enzyme YgiQ (UPF0313 family)